MLYNKVVWSIATELISSHGTDAETAASLCLSKAKWARKHGDALGWLLVLLAVEELLKAERDYGEWPN
jgi:hypothetical protein